MDTFKCGHPRTQENTTGTKTPRCTTCNRERGRRYREINKDKERVRAREAARKSRGGLKGHKNSQKTHCSKGHEYTEENTYRDSSGWRQCRTCRKVAVKEWFNSNRDLNNERRRKRYAEDDDHRNKILEGNRKWAADNPETVNLISRLKKQARRAAGNLTVAEWRSVLEEFGGQCLACESDDPVTIDHVIPISKGGSNTRDNVQPLCGSCNSSKSDKTVDYRPHGATS